jgi:hypothetical protein
MDYRELSKKANFVQGRLELASLVKYAGIIGTILSGAYLIVNKDQGALAVLPLMACPLIGSMGSNAENTRRSELNVLIAAAQKSDSLGAVQAGIEGRVN